MERRMIVITPEERNFLQKMFHVSAVTIWHAVKFVRNNAVHKMIRKAALERGAVQMLLLPEFETLFVTNWQEADPSRKRYMIQTFENGAMLEGCLETGHVELRKADGEVVEIWENPHITEIPGMQERAQML